MPFFFERKSEPTPFTDVLDAALGQAAILDLTERKATAKQLMAEATRKPPKFRKGRLLTLIGLLAGLLILAVNIGNDDAKAALLDCFKVAFAAMMTLLGFEASQNG